MTLRKRLGAWLRSLFVRHVIFSGDFADVLAARRKFAATHDVIFLGAEYKKERIGRKKLVALVVFYVDDDIISKWLGFRKGEPHRLLKYH